jgi:hypothetical protein
VTSETPEFGPAVLGNLPALVPDGMTEADLALELGLSAHLQTCGLEADEALDELWAVRQAILEATDMDPATEPIPLGGRSDRLGLLHITVYLGHLVHRAARHQGCEPESVVRRASLRPVLTQVRTPRAGLRRLRTS